MDAVKQFDTLDLQTLYHKSCYFEALTLHGKKSLLKLEVSNIKYQEQLNNSLKLINYTNRMISLWISHYKKTQN